MENAEVDPYRYKLIFDKSSKTICTFLADTTEDRRRERPKRDKGE